MWAARGLRAKSCETNEYVRSLVDRAGVMAWGVHQNPASLQCGAPAVRRPAVVRRRCGHRRR
jgi:hypothetical protein